jgi:hypothetical protein
VAGGERGTAGRRAAVAAFQRREVTPAWDLASGPMLGLDSRLRERTGWGPRWADAGFRRRGKRKYKRLFNFQNVSIKAN